MILVVHRLETRNRRPGATAQVKGDRVAIATGQALSARVSTPRKK